MRIPKEINTVEDDPKGRRDFFKECAKYASVTAPMMVLLLSPEKVLAKSPGAGGYQHGDGEHHHGKRRRRRHKQLGDLKRRRRRKRRKWREARKHRDEDDE